MKKALLMNFLLSFVFMVSAFSQQPKQNNIDTTSEWRVNDSWWEPPATYDYNNFRYYINGTENIGSYEYYKVFRSGYHTQTYMSSTIFYVTYNELFSGYLREENNKWFTIDNNNQDILLFDFTLNKGDTVKHPSITEASNVVITVDSVDTIMVDNEAKRRLHLDINIEYCTEYIIEDIGSTAGLWEIIWFFEWESELVCYGKNGISVWGASTQDCEFNVGLAVQNPKLPLSVYPNPAESYVNIDLPFISNTEFTIQMFDSYGRMVYNESGVQETIIRIVLDAYKPGLYLVSIQSPEHQSSYKLIID